MSIKSKIILDKKTNLRKMWDYATGLPFGSY